MLRFLRADKISDVESAERILSRYRNKEVELKLNSSSFGGNLLDAQAEEGVLYVKYTWKKDGTNRRVEEIDHMYRYIQSQIGKPVRFQVNTDAFTGILSSATELPEGATLERYADSPFVLTFAFTEQDQRVTAGTEGSIIGVPVPKNIADQLHMGDLEHPPHITVAYFPDIQMKDVENILRIAEQVARNVGTMSLFLDGPETFPTPSKDNTYPLVAKVKSSELSDFHNQFVELMERFYPDLVDTTFACKNYSPHVTLSYEPEARSYVPVKSLAWTTDELYLSFRGGKKFFPIPLRSDMRTADESGSYLQIGGVQVPVVVLKNDKSGDLRIRVKRAVQSTLVDDMEGLQIALHTPEGVEKMEIKEVRESGPDGYQIFYRPLITYLSPREASLLRYVEAVAQERGLQNIVQRISSLLSFSEEDEGEDKEALGPGFPGTDSRIVTYVKAPQTQEHVEDPEAFPRTLPLHRRIS